MQSFVIRPMTWPVLRVFSRNPLIRASDPIETAVVTLGRIIRGHRGGLRRQWERDIRCLVDDDGGRTNRSQ